MGRVACSIARRLLSHALASLRGPLARRLRAQYSLHLFRARARLDLPTFEDPLVQRQLEEASSTSGSIAYDTLVMGAGIVSTLVQVVSQVGVLAQVLGGQRDGWLLAGLSFATSMGDWVTRWNVFATHQGEWLFIPMQECEANPWVSLGCDDEGQGLYPNDGYEICREQYGAPEGVHRRQPC